MIQTIKSFTLGPQIQGKQTFKDFREKAKRTREINQKQQWDGRV